MQCEILLSSLLFILIKLDEISFLFSSIFDEFEKNYIFKVS